MRWALFAIVVVAACRPGAAPHVQPASATIVPRLLPPPALVDLDSPSAVYRTAVALQVQPSWAGFLDDCRLRLPANHSLNDLRLVAHADIAVDAAGSIVEVMVASSGNSDFDRAVRQVIADAAPLPRPPRELWSDDDRVHLRWVFARDRRQAGPATASIVDKRLPVRDVVERLVAASDLTRAARRVIGEPAGQERDVATRVLMIAALREAVASSPTAVRRAAVDAIGRASLTELAPLVRELVTATNDPELRTTAVATLARLHDAAAVPMLVEQLRTDIRTLPQLARQEIDALRQLGATSQIVDLLRAELESDARPNPTALEALVVVPMPDLDRRVEAWAKSSDVRVRGAACSRATWTTVARLVRDRAATVRARCLHIIEQRGRGSDAETSLIAKHARELVRDRDASVRAAALLALGILDPRAVPDASDDRDVAVRVALARATAWEHPGTLLELIEDRAAPVRAAAWRAFGGDVMLHAEAAAIAVTDRSAEVRLAALPAITDDDTLARLATTDDDPAVRTEALVMLAWRRTRAAYSDELLRRMAEAAPGSADRVRTALAWLLSR